MPSSGYAAWSVVAGEQPTTAKWNILGSNDASFNTGNGFNDNILATRHLPTSGFQVIDKSVNPYKFSAYGSVLTGLAAGFVATKITFGTKEYDTGSNFDSVTNNRFTAPIAGFYQFNAAYQSASGATGEFYTIFLYKNGTLFKTGTGQAATGANTLNHVVAPPPFQLAANDYIEVFGAQNSGGIKNTVVGQDKTYFGGFLVSAT